MDAPLVHLNPAEVDLVWQLARRRRFKNLREGRTETQGAPVEGRWDRELEGLGAECAAAKLLGIYFDGQHDDDKAPDVGPFEIRQTRFEDGCLRLYRSDQDERIALLFVGLLPNFRFGGWIRGADGKRDHYWNKGRDRQPCFHVPQSDLAAWETLPWDFEHHCLLRSERKRHEHAEPHPAQ